MRPSQSFATELAVRLDRLEAGAPPDERRFAAPDQVGELVGLAHALRALPPVEPDRRWLAASKQRLLARLRA